MRSGISRLPPPARSAEDPPMVTIILPLLVAVVGVLIYALATNAKLSEIGRLMFFVGLFFCVWVASGRVLTLR